MPHPSRRAAGLMLAGLAGACTLGPPPPVAILPFEPGLVTADPARQAILHSAYALARPASLVGHPAIAAQTISEVEFLAVELRYASRWAPMSPLVTLGLERARPQWRAALGIEAAAPPQAVIDAMTALRFAVGAQDAAAAAAALRAPLFSPGGQGSLVRLSNLPPLPAAARAASLAEQEMWRMQRQGNRDMNWR